jgi:hypothetical protein
VQRFAAPQFQQALTFEHCRPCRKYRFLLAESLHCSRCGPWLRHEAPGAYTISAWAGLPVLQGTPLHHGVVPAGKVGSSSTASIAAHNLSKGRTAAGIVATCKVRRGVGYIPTVQLPRAQKMQTHQTQALCIALLAGAAQGNIDLKGAYNRLLNESKWLRPQNPTPTTPQQLQHPRRRNKQAYMPHSQPGAHLFVAVATPLLV